MLDPVGSLRERFLAALRGPARTAVTSFAPDEVEAVLVGHLAAAAVAWPDVQVASDAFVTHLAGHTPAAVTLESLYRLRATDLYLACACTHGDGVALVAFERAYLCEVDIAAARLRAGTAIADEVKQTLRRALLVAEPGRRPAIAEYAGRGDLRGWVRVSAMRATQLLVKRSRREVELDDQTLFSLVSPADDPELDHLRNRYREPFRDAFHDALVATSAQERSLLRYQLVDGLTIDDLARLLKVHRATAARRVAAVRTGILTRTREALRQRMGLTSEELDSVIRLLRSRLDVSVERLLQ
jgi:RNA polymerase sigma-70 factor (ECF subfamily)